ncbi:MAG TPA: response regulator [Gammaproteobacteria bacterium]|nr:response regulator [Gammaproteobacteria bacterium]
MTKNKTVYLIDDDAAVRHALGMFLESAGYQVDAYASARDFLETYDNSSGGVLLLDQRMPGMSGMELQGRLAQLGVFLPIIFITGHGDIQMSVAAMKAGAMDFLEKPFDNSELLRRIRDALKKAAGKRKEWELRTEVEQRCATLTSRELEVMRYIVQGMSCRAIAERLGVSNRTIEVHRARVMTKMKADSLPDLVRKSTLCNAFRETAS